MGKSEIELMDFYSSFHHSHKKMKTILVAFSLVTLIALSSAEFGDEDRLGLDNQVDDATSTREKRQRSANESKVKCSIRDRTAFRELAQFRSRWTNIWRSKCSQGDKIACAELHSVLSPRQ